MDCHCIIGEMLLEYLKEACKKMGEMGKVEHFVTSATKKNDAVKRLNIFQDHFPIKKVMWNIIMFCLSETPAKNRDTDDYMPRPTGIAKGSLRIRSVLLR